MISRPSRPQRIIKEERSLNLLPGEKYVFPASPANNSAYQDEHQKELVLFFWVGACEKWPRRLISCEFAEDFIFAPECKFNLEVKINAESSLSFYGRFYLSGAVFSFIFTLSKRKI